MTDYKQHEIHYTDKWTGQKQTHVHTGSDANARGWAKSLSNDNQCKAICEKVSRDGSRSHIVSEGSDG